MSGHVSAASEDLAAQSKGKPVAIHSQSKREPDAEKREPDAEKRESMAEMSSKSETEPDAEKREPMAEMSSKSEIEPDTEIPSQSERNPFPEIAYLSKRRVTWSEGKSDDAENEKWPHGKSDDGQSLSGKSSPRSSDRCPDAQREWITEVEWLGFIKDDTHVPARSLSDVSIFKIPDFLKDTKREAYVPRRVLLGPYHHGRKNVRAVYINKKRALCGMKTKFNKEPDSQNVSNFAQPILKKTDDPNDRNFYHNVIEAILKNEGEIRDSYEESIDPNKESLARMLSVDGCFVLDVLKNVPEDREKNLPEDGENNPLSGENKAFASNALKDISMLENQIPWIVLLELLRLENPKEDDVKKNLLNLMVNGTSRLLEMSHKDTNARLQLNSIQSGTTKVRHFLDFVHKVIVHPSASEANSKNEGEHRISIESCIGRCLQMPQVESNAPNQDSKTIPPADESNAPNQDSKTIPPAVELKNAGIKFGPCSGGIQKIWFDRHRAKIYLPLLSITANTEVLFRNLIAFEMCRPSETDYYVSSYVNLMDDLIDSQKDVAFLRSTGIITNQLGSDQEVADLFNGLFKGVTVSMTNKFSDLKKEVNANYKNTIRVQLEELWRDHCSTPWKAIPWLAGLAILCLTLIQTIYAPKK